MSLGKPNFISVEMTIIIMQEVEKHYSGKGAEAGPYLEVTFEKDELKLEIEEDGVTLDYGWSLVPLVCPTSVRKCCFYRYLSVN